MLLVGAWPVTTLPLNQSEGAADETLLAAVRDRDAAALEALYDKHHAVALSVALRLVRNQQVAEDVVQDAFLAVWRQAGTFAGQRGSVRNWLLSIVHHRAIDWLRRREVAQPPVALETLEAATGALPDTHGGEVWEDAARSIERQQVHAALTALPVEQRQTVELAYFGGLTCQEIGERLGVPLGTVKGRMRLALRKLRVALGPDVLFDVTGESAGAAGSTEVAG